MKRFLKFCVVGGSGAVVNLGLYWILTRYFLIYELLSYAISIEISILSNFALNNVWTFRDRKNSPLISRFTKFHLVSFGGMAINWCVFALLFTVFGVFDMYSAIGGIAVATLWNYFINLKWTWRS